MPVRQSAPRYRLRLLSRVRSATSLVVLASVTSFGVAAELVVVDQDGCPYCERFEAEIAPAWPNTAEGRQAPLRRVDLHGDWPVDLAGVEPAFATPTFILVDDGQEIDRLIGYPGDEYFWFLIGGLLEQLDAGDSSGEASSSGDR